MSGEKAILEATAIVLAGGRSSRMGCPKSLLPISGTPLVLHVVRALERRFVDIVVVAAPDQELPPLPADIVRDEVANQGPLGGLYYGLSSARTKVSFVISCDVVFINMPLISHLIGKIADFDVVVPFWQGRFQPLHAAYRSEMTSQAKRLLDRGELRAISLCDMVHTLKIEEDEIRRFDPEGLSFISINTPEDYQAALTRWRKSLSPGCPIQLD
jgi:molybdenum cofactor guanylyltransferase